MPARANGSFEVKLSPQPADETGVGRLTIDKQFHGHLEATSKGLAGKMAITIVEKKHFYEFEYTLPDVG